MINCQLCTSLTTNATFPYHEFSVSVRLRRFHLTAQRYARACSSYECFITRIRRSNKLLAQWYVKGRLKLSLRKFYGRYGNRIKQSDISRLSRMLHDVLERDHMNWYPPPDRCRTGVFYPNSGRFPWAFPMGVAGQQRTLTCIPRDTWSGSTWTCICSNVESSISKTCHVSGPWISNILRYFHFIS